MDILAKWLLDLNLFQVLLTVLFTSWITTKNSKKDMLKGIQVTEQVRNEVISEMRGQISSIRGEKK